MLDVHFHALLLAAGYSHQFYPAEYWDDGDAENGPHLTGHPDVNVYTLPVRRGVEHEICVYKDGVVTEELGPSGPAIEF